MMKLDLNNEEQLKDLYRHYRPIGSGPLGVMKVVCSLIEAVAEEKGYNVAAWKEDFKK